MQPVLDGEILEIAQPGVDAAQRIAIVNVALNPGIACDAGALRRFDDEARKSVAPLAIETVSLSVFVHEPLEFACTCGERRRDERRRQMSNRYSCDAALGLRRLPRIAEDEGIEDGNCAGEDLGKAG